MNKRLLSLILGLVMVLGAFTSVFAAEETKKEEKVEKIVGKDNKIQYIIDKKFVEGYGNGDYGYDKNIKRSEITKLLVFANGNKELSEKLQGSMKLYKDVETSHWANGVITVGSTVPSSANKLPMLNGYPTGDFKPEADVTYAELAKMLVVLVKEDLTADMVKTANANWASQWMTWAAQLGILDDVTVANSSAPANRADAFTMVYNAMYKMTNFKRVPADEKVGVLSAFNRSGKLVLNQDAKDNEYTVTDQTVFVNTYKYERSNTVLFKDITNPEYYVGSLVRIMFNDKKEVTHILELGNPRNMALGRPEGTVGDNARWQGVADATVSTGFTKANTLKENVILNGWAEIGFNTNKTKVNKIIFHNPNKTVSINSNTKVYVANPYNNIMREVKDINEAMSLIGYNQHKWNNIPNVYAGFNTDGHKSALKGFDAAGRDTATVVVFNVVMKSEGGDLYRVINQSSSLGNATVEDTDGKIIDRDFFKNASRFPYNYGDLYDVIEVNPSVAMGTDGIVRRIDHSNTTDFPVVEVTNLYNDGKSLELRDVNNYKTVVDTRDADIFNAKQFKDLKVGAKVQFATTDRSKTIDILSILPYNTKVEGSMRDIIKSAYGDTVTAVLLDVNVNAAGNLATISVNRYYNIFDQKDGMGRAFFYVTTDKANLLKPYIGQEIVFDVVKDMNGFYGKAFADNFRLNDGKETPIKESNEVLTAIETLEAKAKLGNAVTADKDAAVAQKDTLTSISAQNALQVRINKALEENAKKAVENFLVDAKNSDLTDAAYTASKDKAEAAITLKGNDAALTAKVDDADEVHTAKKALVNREIIVNDKTLAPAKEAIKTDLEQGLVKVVSIANPVDGVTYTKDERVTVKLSIEKNSIKDYTDIVVTVK